MMMSLIKKGIAIHHSGILPILREIVELFFAKGYIKLLFATETFAVGINMPTKTVIFTSFSKFDGNDMRYLLPHEYTQMAGRAGRRGLDTEGHVIHCNNLFDMPDIHTYKRILCGDPQFLRSKFKVSYNLVEETAKIGRLPVVNFAAGGIATPADAAYLMSLGCDGIFVGSGIFKAEDAQERARAVVLATTFWEEPDKVKDAQKMIDERQSLLGLDVKNLELKMQDRGSTV